MAAGVLHAARGDLERAQALMAAPQYDTEHRRLRRALIAMLAVSGPWPCPRCGEDMFAWQRLDLGHAVDVRMGGFGGPRRLEHSRCNRSAGGQLATQIREGKQAAVRSAAERAAHDHRRAVRLRREWKLAEQQQTGRDWLGCG